MQTEMEYVYTVYKEKSFSKAAKKLFVSQSAVSSMVKKAEEKLGCELFDRSSIPLSVTREGEYYVRCAEKILDIEHEMESFFNDAKDLKTGSITIGTSSFYCVHYITDIVRAFRKKYPNIQSEIYEGNARELDLWLAENKVDLVFGALWENNSDNQTFFFEPEHIILGVPKSFPVNDTLKEYQIPVELIRNNQFLEDSVPAVPLINFKDYPFISLKKGNDIYSRCIQICKNAGFTPQLDSLLDQFITAYYAACTGIGIIMLRSTLVDTQIDRGELIYYKIGDPLATRPISFAMKKRSYVSNATRAFLTVAYGLYKKELPDI